MDAFVEIPLPGGGSLVVEESRADGVVQAGRGRRAADWADWAEETFESALDRVSRAADAVRQRMLTVDQPPDEVTVEFAIKLGAEIGVVVASGAAEANLKLVVRWTASDERK